MDENKQKALEAAMAQIEKQFGKGSVMKMDGTEIDESIEAISTGSLGLDIALGIGGLPKGRVVEIYGPESSGKTSLTLSVIAAAQKAAIEVLMSEPEHHSRLWENTNYFRKELQSLGFDTGVSETPIIPIICGESLVAKQLSNELSKENVMAGAIVFPMVSREKARVRTQMSASLTRNDLDDVLYLLEKIGPKLNLL